MGPWWAFSSGFPPRNLKDGDSAPKRPESRYRGHRELVSAKPWGRAELPILLELKGSQHSRNQEEQGSNARAKALGQRPGETHLWLNRWLYCSLQRGRTSTMGNCEVSQLESVRTYCRMRLPLGDSEEGLGRPSSPQLGCCQRVRAILWLGILWAPQGPCSCLWLDKIRKWPCFVLVIVVSG